MPRKKLPITMPLDIANVIESSSLGYFHCLFDGEQDKKSKEIIFENVSNPWRGAFYHFINSQCKFNMKFPGSNQLKTATKPRGELLIKTYELCKECHAKQEIAEVNIPYTNASIWFSKCYRDFSGTEIQEILTEELKVYNNNYKEAVIERRFAKLRAMRQGVNPYKIFKDATGLIFLVETAIKLSLLPLKFNQNYWKPFLSAFSKEAIEMKSQRWEWFTFKNGYYQASSGRGRPSKIIS